MNIYKNSKKVLMSPIGLFGFILGLIIIIYPSTYFLDKELIIGNLGYIFYITEVLLTIIIGILFGLFLGATLYKVKYFNKNKKGIGVLGGFLGILVSGCPACSITIASYIGLASILSIFPFYGLELKVLSIFMIIYAYYSTIKTLEICKVKIK